MKPMTSMFAFLLGISLCVQPVTSLAQDTSHQHGGAQTQSWTKAPSIVASRTPMATVIPFSTSTQYMLAGTVGWDQPAPVHWVSAMSGTPAMVVSAEYLASGGIAGCSDDCAGDGCCGACGGQQSNSCGCSQVGILGAFGPLGDCGCCRPRWFDIYTGVMYLKRDNQTSNVDFTIQDGESVLGTDRLGAEDEELGMRFTASLFTGPGSSLEAAYFGLFEWSSTASVVGSDNLESVLNQFGALQECPAAADASQHTISHDTSLYSVEVNLRRRWRSADCRFHSSALIGARYVNLEEDFDHLAIRTVNTGSLRYLVSTQNDLIGAQVGGESFLCVIPGLMIGADVKAGAYGNSANQNTVINCGDDGAEVSYNEEESNWDICGLGEANAMVVLRLTPRLTLRAGYSVLYMHNVALAPENYNDVPPEVLGPPAEADVRTVGIDTDGKPLYHGFVGGGEFTW